MLLVLLLSCGLLASHTAAQSDPNACYISDAQLVPAADSCNSTCREATLEALKSIYQKLGGPTWNFNIEDETGAARNLGGWPDCSECRPSGPV
jgi:hypothetical protein